MRRPGVRSGLAATRSLDPRKRRHPTSASLFMTSRSRRMDDEWSIRTLCLPLSGYSGTAGGTESSARLCALDGSPRAGEPGGGGRRTGVCCIGVPPPPGVRTLGGGGRRGAAIGDGAAIGASSRRRRTKTEPPRHRSSFRFRFASAAAAARSALLGLARAALWSASRTTAP